MTKTELIQAFSTLFLQELSLVLDNDGCSLTVKNIECFKNDQNQILFIAKGKDFHQKDFSLTFEILPPKP